MRPVEKFPIGDKDLPDGSKLRVQAEYKPYQSAKELLEKNIGNFCSYCEVAIHRSRDLEVEHVQPQSKYPEKEYHWENFLIACGTCNGRDNKGSKDVDLAECHFPHRNNTLRSFIYRAGGVIMVNPQLNALSQKHAENLYKLVGLDKPFSNTDNRWKTRLECWNKANIYKNKYAQGECKIATIIDLMKGYGGWSIWFTVFSGYDEVRKSMIEEFPGTAINCFDADNHYEPIDRNPGQADPV